MTILGSNPRARVNTRHPEAWGVCDRCGFVFNLVNLNKQYGWRGNNLVWNGYLVCKPCLDVPFQLNRPLFLPPDPPPVINPRPNMWAQQAAETEPPDQQLIPE